VDQLELDPGTLEASVEDSVLLAGLGDEARADVLARLEPLLLPGGEVLTREGDEADALYLVLGGRLEVSIDRDGEKVLIGHIGRGELVGEMALVTRELRTATVRALRDTQLLRLGAPAFADIVAAHPEALRAVSGTIVARHVESFQRTVIETPVTTVAVVPIDPGPPADFAPRLGAALADLVDSVTVLDRAGVEGALGQDEDSGLVDPAGLARLLTDQEATHDLTVLVASTDDEKWTDACVRQADLVLMVADATRGPRRRPVEDRLASAYERRVDLVLLHPARTEQPSGTDRWLEARTVHRHHHVRVGTDAHVERVARLISGNAVGLVLSGGGARGLAHLGVIQAFEDLGIPIDLVGGTSMGAAIGATVAIGFDGPKRERSLRRVLLEGPTALDVTFPAVSLASGRRITARMRDFAGDILLEDAWRSFYCVSCNLSRCERVVHDRGPGWEALRASFAIPGIYPPIRRGDDLLVDGGVLDNMPVGEMRRREPGATVIAVDVSARDDLKAGDLPAGGVLSGWRTLGQRLNPLVETPDIAGITQVLMRLTELSSTARQATERADLTVRPDVSSFTMMDFAAIDDLVAVGHQAGRRQLEAWLAETDRPWVTSS
jgi:predicted acylesterase/phospholipase RssA/CRP-like cAMP-binding protein